jgi:hypothetical protein
VLPPAIVLAIALLRKDAFDILGGGTAWKLAVVAVLALAMLPGLLRGNLQARFADVSEPVGVLVAALIGLLVRRSRPVSRSLARAAAGVMLCVALYSVQLIEKLTLQISETGFDRGSGAVLTHARDIHAAFTAYPPVTAWNPREAGDVAIASFVSRCTRQDDRLLVVGYLPQLYFLAGRGFANGSPWVLPDYFITDDDQAFMIDRIERHRVPVVFTVPEQDYRNDYEVQFGKLDAYLRAHYRQVTAAAPDTLYDLRVMVRNDLTPVRDDAITGLPCYAAG